MIYQHRRRVKTSWEKIFFESTTQSRPQLNGGILLMTMAGHFPRNHLLYSAGKSADVTENLSNGEIDILSSGFFNALRCVARGPAARGRIFSTVFTARLRCFRSARSAQANRRHSCVFPDATSGISVVAARVGGAALEYIVPHPSTAHTTSSTALYSLFSFPSTGTLCSTIPPCGLIQIAATLGFLCPVINCRTNNIFRFRI